MTKSEFTKITWERFQKWSESQEGQTSGYEYEKSFDKMLVEMGKGILEKEVANKKEPLREKKNKDPFWKHENSTKPPTSDTNG